jgi:hypothetical protein
MSDEIKKAPLPAKTPGDLVRKGVFDIGVDWSDRIQKKFEVGPLTTDVEIEADATMPAFIDELVMSRHQMLKMPAKQLEETMKKTEMKKPPAPLSQAEKNAVIRMYDVQYKHYCKYRLLKLGMVPKEMIPEVAGKLLPNDFAKVVNLCREVDKAEEQFRKSHKNDLGEGTDTVDGGGSDGSDIEFCDES